MSFIDLAKSRYSVRGFKRTPVEEEKIKKILEAGKIAPTAKNSQPQKIYVLKSEEAIEKINKLSPCIYGAPLVFVIGYDKDRAVSVPARDYYNFGAMDSTIVATHMILEATDLGLGSCWVGMFNDVEVQKTFELPDNIQVTALMPVGYTADGVGPAKMHEECRPDDEMIEYR